MDPLLTFTGLVFVCATLLTLVGFWALEHRGRRLRRFGALQEAGSGSEEQDRQSPWAGIDPARLGLNTTKQRRLRVELVRAGFFNASAVAIYAAVRVALLVSLPLLGFALTLLAFASSGVPERIAIVAILLLVAISLPKAYLSRRQRLLEASYRNVFPDFLDMLVVCVNAGLSLEAALDRAGRELDTHYAAFRANLDLMAGEMRAGKGTGEALRALAERLTLPEARSFAALLQQTLELGTDIAQSLTVFSDEMRDKRLSTAEEKAAALPPKLTLPLGLFIFPVVLIAVLAPAVIKVMGAFPH